MSLLKSVLLFPTKTLDSSFINLSSTPPPVHILPPYIASFLYSYINLGVRKIFGKSVGCIFFHYDEEWPEPLETIEFIKEQLKLYEKVVMFGPYVLLVEIHRMMEDSYFHIPEAEDKEYVIEFILCPNCNEKHLVDVREADEIDQICLQ
jgi:hypothetical protein